EHAPRRGVDHRGGVVAHVTGDDSAMRRLASGDAEHRHQCESDHREFHGGKCEAPRKEFQPRESKGFVISILFLAARPLSTSKAGRRWTQITQMNADTAEDR